MKQDTEVVERIQKFLRNLICGLRKKIDKKSEKSQEANFLIRYLFTSARVN